MDAKLDRADAATTILNLQARDHPVLNGPWWIRKFPFKNEDHLHIFLRAMQHTSNTQHRRSNNCRQEKSTEFYQSVLRHPEQNGRVKHKKIQTTQTTNQFSARHQPQKPVSR